MGNRPDLATSDRQSKTLLVALLLAALVVFLWLVASLTSSAFG
ncbi:MAG TPA: hypothetical protein VF230_03935 [Acidimicrobiales bacterium]